jgi:hypothetical protein
MSIKDLFGKTSGQIVTQKDLESLKQDVESIGYVEELKEERSRFVPKAVVDFDNPKTFARFGSAQRYFLDAIESIYKTYPYDGSYKEKLAWRNSSSYIDNYIFDNEYPRTTGYILLNEPQAHPAGPVISGTSWDYRDVTSSPQYVFFEGGMNTGSTSDGTAKKPFTNNSNVYDPEVLRESNLYAVGQTGNTIEFWWKREPDPTTGISAGSECLFDAWNNEVVGDPKYGRIVIEHWNDDWQADPTVNGFVKFTYYSDGDGIQRQTLGTSLLPAEFDPNEWHHYAFTAVNSGEDLLVKFHVDGELVDEITVVGEAIGSIEWIPDLPLTARVGAYQEKPVTTEVAAIDFVANVYGSVQGSIDEFRFWKKARTSKEIGRYWITQFGGGTNTDEANTTLGIYYKFNEGIVDVGPRYDIANASVLDYSGRTTNARIANYDTGVRSTGSAIDESDAKSEEFRDPILYPFHQDVSAYQETKSSEGYEYDVTNSGSLRTTLPGWILENPEGDRNDELDNLMQIISSYFDTLYLQVEALPSLGDAEYIQEEQKPIPFAAQLLKSKGLVAPEIFIDATIFEFFVNRTEDKTYEDDLVEMKNIIYQNIYNNIANIYKSKGTEKAFRNFMRCFGIGDKLVKINLYGDNVKIRLDDYYRSVSSKRSFVDFNNVDRYDATVYQEENPDIVGSKGYIEGAASPGDLDYMPFTMECEVVFPKKLSLENPNFFQTPFTRVSLFGMHEVDPTGDVDVWTPADVCGFAVYADKIKQESKEVKFIFKPYGFGLVSEVETDFFKDVYDNTKWNFAVSVRSLKNPLIDFVENSDTTPEYVLEFYGVSSVLDIVQDEFKITIPLDPVDAKLALNSVKRLYVGSEYGDFKDDAEELLNRCDAKIGSTRLWLDYIDDETVKVHARDVDNYGTIRPFKESYFGQTVMSEQRVPQADTLVLHWNFETVGASSPDDGTLPVSDSFFYVDDVAYAYEDDRYGPVSNILGYQYTGKGYFFLPDDTKVIDRTYIFSAKQQLPEIIGSYTTVNILDQDDDVFTRESQPFNYFWAIEKSMYQNISEEIIDIFATIQAYNNLIGEPVNRYRLEYKDLGKLRQLFFERIENDPDIEKYIEFYKWIDTGMNQMLQQLIPASANFSEDMRTLIESHILERNKYRNKYGYFGDRQEPDPTPLLGVNEMLYNWKCGFASIREDENCLWWKTRARRDHPPLATGDEELDEDRQQIFEVATRVNSGSWEDTSLAYGEDYQNMTEYKGSTFALRSLSKPYRFAANEEPVLRSGNNSSKSKKKHYVRSETQSGSGNTVVINNVPTGDCYCEEVYPLSKRKVPFKAGNQKYSRGAYENEAKGDILSPLDLYQNVNNDEHYWTNIHFDSYGDDREVPAQGPFTEAHVGGSFNRHVSINEDDRVEAWQFDTTLSTTSATGTFSEPADQRAKLFRDEIAKRPVNIKNIKFDIDDAIYGNYRFDYEIIQTSSRRINNVWFVKQQGVLPGAEESVQSDAVFGHYDFELPNRGRTEHVFVERFSAPGSSDTLARGMMDVESEEFSPYNALPFRNLNVRTKLNQWLTFHSKFGGLSASCDNPTDEYPCVPSFHKTQRNEKERFVEDVSEFCEIKHDNFWKTELIPVSDYGYHWISQSTQEVTRWCRTGYVSEYDNVATYYPEIDADPYSASYGLPGIAGQVISGEIGFEYGLPFVNNFQDFTPKNANIFNKIGSNPAPNPAPVHARAFDKLTMFDDKTGEQIVFETLPCSNVWDGTFLLGDIISDNKEWEKYLRGVHNLNALLNNRDGPFTYPMWKQIRKTEHKALRYFRKHNVISIEEKNSKKTTFINPGIGFDSEQPINVATNYIEPGIAWNVPMNHRVKFNGGSTGAFVIHTYNNNLEMFANPFINKRLGIQNKNEQMYDLLLKQYLKPDTPSTFKFYELKYEEYIYPKHRNVTLNRTRQRLRYPETKTPGDNSINRRSSKIRTFWTGETPLDRQRRNYNPYTPDLTAKNALGSSVRNSSVWALDYFKYIEPSTGLEQVMRGDLAWAGYAQWRSYVYEPKAEAEILPAGAEEGNGEVNNATWIAPRPVLQYIHNPQTKKAKEEGWAWKAGEIAAGQPWFKSYDQYKLDVKPMGQNYSIVPEYRISEHMDYYINQNGGNFRADNKNILEIVGNPDHINSSAFVSSTQKVFYSQDNGITETEEYVFEPNCANGFQNILGGQVEGTELCTLEQLCPQEGVSDIDSVSTSWNCATDYPVAQFSSAVCSSASNFIPNIGSAGIATKQKILFGLNETNAYKPLEFKTQEAEDAFDNYVSSFVQGFSLNPALPVSFAPRPDPEFCDRPAANVDTALLNADNQQYWDRWENSFLVSFWYKPDGNRIVEEYFENGEMARSIGGFTIKGENDGISPQDILGKTQTELLNIYGLADNDELENFINSRFAIKSVETVITSFGNVVVDSAYVYYTFFRQFLELLVQYNNIGCSGQNPPSQCNSLALLIGEIYWKILFRNGITPYYEGTQANFYISDHTDATPNADGLRYRPCWIDNIGNKIHFDITFGQENTPYNQWYHISLLYIGGSRPLAPLEPDDTAAIGYNPEHHRVFLWVDNERVDSESIYEEGDFTESSNQKYNGTILINDPLVDQRDIRSFGSFGNSFVFGACEESIFSPGSNVDAEYELEYEIPEAYMPGRMTDVAFYRGGEVGVEFLEGDGFTDQFDPACNNRKTLASRYKWLFDNTKPAAATERMICSLVKNLYESQCLDLNDATSSWVANGGAFPPEELTVEIGGDPNSFMQEVSTFARRRQPPDFIGWWKLGIPVYSKQSYEDYIWNEDFFKCFAHTDQIFHLGRVGDDSVPLGPDSSKVVRLEINALKKLLPYNGFYPSQRAVQLGSLFYDSYAPFVSGANDNVARERNRTEQALLQPFFAPGILFNTIKSGIAVDWAAYAGKYDSNGFISMRDEFLGEFVFVENESETETSFANFSNNNSPGGIEALKNTEAGKVIIKRAISAMSRDVLLGKLNPENVKSSFSVYYNAAIQIGLSEYERLSRKLSRISSARSYEQWAKNRSLSPLDLQTQEQYRSTVVRDVDWKYQPGYSSNFKKQLKSLVDKTANSKANDVEYINTLIIEAVQQINLLPPAEAFNVEFDSGGVQIGNSKAKGFSSDTPGSSQNTPPFSSDTSDPPPQFDLIGGEIIGDPPQDSAFNPPTIPQTGIGNLPDVQVGIGSIIGNPPQTAISSKILQELLTRPEGAYLNAPPNFRIPFEAIVDPSNSLPFATEEQEAKIFFLAPSFYNSGQLQTGPADDSQNRYPYFEWNGQRNILYDLAMNNFLAEIPNFFLKKRGLTTFASVSEDKFKTVISGEKYFMDVHLYKTEEFAMTISPYDGEAVLVNKNNTEDSPSLIDNDGNPYTTQGRYYGPAVRYKANASSDEDLFYIGDPAQAPYTPPYFYGRAKARIIYTANLNGKPTLDDILNNVEIEYINQEMDQLFAAKAGPNDPFALIDPSADKDSFKQVPAYRGRMPIESSINFFGRTNNKNIQYNINQGIQPGFVPVGAEDELSSASRWTISSKFECPVLNFDTIENKTVRTYKVPQISNSGPGNLAQPGNEASTPSLEKGEYPNIEENDRNIYGAVSRDPRGVGMWSGFGFIPSQDRGIFMTLEESFKKRKDPKLVKKKNVETYEFCVEKKASTVSLALKEGFENKLTKIELEDIFGEKYEISIGQTSFADDDNNFPKFSLSADETSYLGLPDNYSGRPYSFSSFGQFIYSPKIRTLLTAKNTDLDNPSVQVAPYNGIAYTNSVYDVEFYKGVEENAGPGNNKTIYHTPSSVDIANAICYHINYKRAVDDTWDWEANIRWLKTKNSNYGGAASETNSVGEDIPEFDSISGITAVLDIRWTPQKIEGKKQVINETPLVKIQSSNYSDESPLSVVGGQELFYISENNQIIENSIDQQFPFYDNPSGITYEFCSEAKSLVGLCGFETEVSRVGDIADEKELSEAVVMIPFVDSAISDDVRASTTNVIGRNLFKIDREVFDAQKVNIDNNKAAVPSFNNGDFFRPEIAETSISDMLKKMRKYNIPPQLDFVTYPDDQPFVMYLFEFSETLNKNDLSNIWQGLMPQTAKTTTKEKKVIEHENDYNNFFGGKEIPENVRWIVFRVKRKANIDYFQLTADSQDDSRFRFNFDVGVKKPEYSYNWPYDFCSLVEMITVKGGISVLPPLEEGDNQSGSQFLTGDEGIDNNKLGKLIQQHSIAPSDKFDSQNDPKVVDWKKLKEEK